MSQYELKAVATLENCRELSRKGRMFLAKYITSEAVLSDLELVLTEGVSNVARHAYADEVPEETKLVELKIKIEKKNKIVIDIIDYGRGLDCSRLDFSVPDCESTGGRGLYIMKRLMDTFDILKEKGKNIIRLTLSVGGGK